MTDIIQKTRTAIVDVLALTGSIDGHFARRLALYLRELDQGRLPADVAMGAAMALYREMDTEWVRSCIGIPFLAEPRTKGQASRRNGLLACWEALASLAQERPAHRHDLDEARDAMKPIDFLPAEDDDILAPVR